MENVFYFAFAGLIVIISLYVILKLLIKKFDPEKTRVRLYGVLGGMSNREIISISCFIICYIFMVYLMVSFIDVNICTIIIVLFLNLFASLMIKDRKFILHTFLSLIALGGIKIIYLIHEYIIDEYMDMWMLLLLVFVMIFLFLYLTYNLLSNLKTVVINNKYIRGGGKSENKERS